MIDLNLVLIDVSAAWVVVMLPRYVQARTLNREGLLGPGQEDRLRPDPVQHMSLLGTFVVPAVTSFFGIPVIAWGKDFDEVPVPRRWRTAVRLVLATAATYAAQAVGFALLTMLLAKIYLAGAPVAARAGQMCVRLTMLSLIAVPVMDAGVAWRFLIPNAEPAKWLRAGISLVLLGGLLASPALATLNEWALIGFFYLTQLF